MNRAHAEIEATGARLLFIGQATPRQSTHFQKRYAPDVHILADESRASYKAMGLPRGSAGQLIGPSSVVKGLGNLRNGVVQGRPVGDVAQLGGTAIVLPGGEIAWTHLAENAGDNASVEEIMEALTRVAA